MSGVVVHIDRFSGPMALLLHLIRKEEMDVFDINIHEITRQYLDSIRAMKKLNLEVAGDFIAMAATLIQIKSKMLLPQYNESGEVLEQEDPRRDLVKRLLEYQMFQEAGHNLYKREILGRNVWARGEKEDLRIQDDSILLEEENALYSLIKAYRACVKNMTKAVHRVSESLQSIADRIMEMREKLVVGRPAKMSELVQLGATGRDATGQLLITFLSLLELAKIGLVNLFQSENFVDIHVEAKGDINQGSISNVETYDAQVHSAKLHEPVKEIWLSDEDAAPVANAVPRIDEQTSMLEVAEEFAPMLSAEVDASDGTVPNLDVIMNAQNMSVNTDAQVLAMPNLNAEHFVEPEMATDEDIFLEEQKLFGQISGENVSEGESDTLLDAIEITPLEAAAIAQFESDEELKFESNEDFKSNVELESNAENIVSFETENIMIGEMSGEEKESEI